uniref:Glo protein n=2 Tax=Primula TaxID=49647 RepID=A5X2S0_9ERIC|nr:Glo-like protein [Primula vulgaris]ABD78320.1 Glo protein [Primula vulgaris]
MGRGKIEIKRIENSNNRQVTYSKRRNGIIKKAKEISLLCDAQVSLVIFANSGKMHDYCSPKTPLINILDAYQKQSGNRLWDAKHENLSNEIERVKKENDNMQIELRHLKGEDVQSLHHKELMSIESALENGLACVRQREMEIYRMARENFADKERVLEDENRSLTYQMHHLVMDIEGGEMENGYNYQSQMPFSFRVQPIQPNLQERI